MQATGDTTGVTFDVQAPVQPVTGFVFASPHSGTVLPEDMRPSPALNEAQLRSAEDALVDRLLDQAPACGLALVTARISRAYVDLNRSPADLDPLLIHDLIPEATAGFSAAKIAAGYGVVPRKAGDGSDLYDRSLDRAEVEARLVRVHAPYHAALTRLMETTRARHGAAVLIDWHSMPSRGGGNGRVRGPDVVLGDRHGTACAARITRRLRGVFEAAGWTVALNHPYAGGYTTQTWGRPDEGFHAIQVELSRALYLDEVHRAPAPTFARCRAVIGQATAALMADGLP